MQKGGGINPTARKTAMTALGVKKKSNEFSPSRFGEKANPSTKKMQKGGDWVDRNIRNPANKWLDKNFRDPANKAASKINKAADKSFRNPVNKKVAKVAKKIDKDFTQPVNAYLDKNLRKVVTDPFKKKMVVKKAVKVKAKRS